MNMIEKLVSYFCLRADGFTHEVAKQEFKRNPITFEDKVVLAWVVFVAIVVGLILFDEHKAKQLASVEQQKRVAEHKRKVAEHKAVKHEQIVLTMLNGGHVRIDGVTRRVCVKDYNGECL